jgi:undecaprenyl-diphosphatase
MESVDWAAYSSFHVWRRQLPRLTEWLQAAGPLGSYPVLGLVLLAGVVWLAGTRRRRTALFLACLVVASAVLAELLKLAIPRERPPDWDHRWGTPLSFPSAHAFVSVVTYGALALLLGRSFAGWTARVALAAAAALLVLLTGTAQLYLGAHFLSDVLAGWAGGLAVLLAGWGLALPDAEPRPG